MIVRRFGMSTLEDTIEHVNYKGLGLSRVRPSSYRRKDVKDLGALTGFSVRKKAQKDELPNKRKQDVWFNPGISPRSASAHEVIGAVVTAAEREVYKRSLKPVERHSFFRVLIPVVANLIRHYLRGSLGGVVVPRGRKALGKKPNRYEPFVFPRPFPKWIDALKELGFAEITLGKYSGVPGASKRSTIKAGAALIDLI